MILFFMILNQQIGRCGQIAYICGALSGYYEMVCISLLNFSLVTTWVFFCFESFSCARAHIYSQENLRRLFYISKSAIVINLSHRHEEGLSQQDN